ncbi:hypothetical protein V1264_014573 [Littorina saxatilis]|uniref:Uncharacterized protein n=2 Tax=Littorina saxatilis TaxID=31220 RepID=A0AAN9GJX2_9CAEN
MVVMELDETHMPSSFGLLREVGKGRRALEKKSEYVAGRPWSKYEAYQLIMQGQAKALVNHKADPSVHDVMLRLWAKYLSLLGVAFVNEGEVRLVPKGLEGAKHTWQRELHRGGVEKPEVNPNGMKRKLKKNEYIASRSKAGKTPDDMGEESFAGALLGETFYEGDNPMENNDEVDTGKQDTDPSSDDSEEFSDSSDNEGEQNPGKWKVISSIQHMTLPKTLAFTYLACIFASNWITVSDILRWVYDGTVPYLETTHLLQPDMKLSAYDQHLFKPTHMTAAMLRYEAGRLLQFLGFETIPDIPVKYICIATTLSLDLPEAVVPRVVRLWRQCPVDVGYKGIANVNGAKSLANVDAVCAAYVLVTLKQIFGLDDNRERLLSKYTKALQERIAKDRGLFDWCAWQTHATYKFLPAWCLQGRQNKLAVSSVDELCRTFESAGYKEQSFSHSKLYTRLKTKKVATFQRDNRDILKRAANILEGRWRNRDATAARTRAEEHTVGDWRDPSQSAPSQDSTSEHFKSSILEHVLNPEEFLHSELKDGDPPSLPKHSEDQSSFESAPASSRFGSGAKSVPPSSRLSSTTSMSPSPSSTRQTSSSSAAASRGTSSQTGEDATSAGRSDHAEDPEEVISQLLGMLSKASDGYVAYPRVSAHNLRNEDCVKELRAKQHSSYKWLLKVLHQWTFCPETDIEQMVWNVEEIMRKKSMLV